LATNRTQRSGRRKTPVAHATTSSPAGSFADIQLLVSTKPKIIGCVDTNPRLSEPTPVIVEAAAMVLPDALTIPARALTSVTSTVEKSAMTHPPEQPPTQVSAQQRRSGCGTLLVALLVLAIITAIVIVLGASGLLDWIFS
jgi:hypothetical protein